MVRIFPTLLDNDGSRAFWQAFRHGILHQATFSLKSGQGKIDGFIGFASLNHPISYHKKQSSGLFHCFVNPILFARAVLKEIEGDFPTFQRAEPDKHPLATVMSADEMPSSFIIDLSGIITEGYDSEKVLPPSSNDSPR